MQVKIFSLFLCLSVAHAALHASDTTSVVKSTEPKPVATTKADASFASQQFRDSYNAYFKAWKQNSASPNAEFKLGLAYSYLLHQPKKQIALFEGALRKTDPNYQFYSKAEKEASEDVLYFMGKAYLTIERLDSAMQFFVAYQNKLHDNLPMDAGRQMKMVLNAKAMMKQPRELNVTTLGEPINTGFDESHPVISIDNKTLFFASRKPENNNTEEGLLSDNDIYIAKAKGENGWETPVPFAFNTEADEEPLFLSIDGNTLYLRRDGKKGGDIYTSTREGDGWSNPKKLSGPVNSPFDEKAISVSHDANWMVISTNKPGGFGGYDLYISKYTGGKWGTPKNMGATINTEMDEVSPYIFPSDKRIYFSTNGNPEYGMGGFDVMFTEIDSGSNAKWSSPFTMGYPVNHSSHELDYIMSADGKSIYTALNKNGDFDLWGIKTGEFQADIEEQLADVIIGTKETQTVEILEVEKEKLVNVDKEVEVTKIEEVEKEVEKNVGYVNATDLKGVDTLHKVVVVEKQDVEVESIVEVEKTVYTNKSQREIDSLNNAEALKGTTANNVDVSSSSTNNLSATNNTSGTGNSNSVDNGFTVITPANNNDNTSNADNNYSPTATNTANNEPVDVSINKTSSDNNINDLLAKKKITQPVFYVIKSGESLQQVADRYDVSVSDIRRWNKLQANTAKPGTALIVGYDYDSDLQHALAMEQLESAGISHSDRTAIIQQVKDDLAKEMSQNRKTVFKTFYFDFNSNALVLSNTELEILVSFLKEHKDVNIEVVGHTDNVGAWETNFWVSRQRAKGMYDFLVAQKISTSRIIFNGKGAIEPIASNSTIGSCAKPEGRDCFIAIAPIPQITEQ